MAASDLKPDPAGMQEGFVLSCGDCHKAGLEHTGVEVITLQSDDKEVLVSCRTCEALLLRLRVAEPLSMDPMPLQRLN